MKKDPLAEVNLEEKEALPTTIREFNTEILQKIEQIESYGYMPKRYSIDEFSLANQAVILEAIKNKKPIAVALTQKGCFRQLPRFAKITGGFLLWGLSCLCVGIIYIAAKNIPDPPKFDLDMTSDWRLPVGTIGGSLIALIFLWRYCKQSHLGLKKAAPKRNGLAENQLADTIIDAATKIYQLQQARKILIDEVIALFWAKIHENLIAAAKNFTRINFPLRVGELSPRAEEKVATPTEERSLSEGELTPEQVSLDTPEEMTNPVIRQESLLLMSPHDAIPLIKAKVDSLYGNLNNYCRSCDLLNAFKNFLAALQPIFDKYNKLNLSSHHQHLKECIEDHLNKMSLSFMEIQLSERRGIREFPIEESNATPRYHQPPPQLPIDDLDAAGSKMLINVNTPALLRIGSKR